ncbi:MAG: class I SAM-dependent methyltransferase [Verrucomicrobiota bacterium]
MEQEKPRIESIVVFANSQGETGRGTLIHITRRLIVFEIYNPYSLVQLSEVLNNVKVMRGERVIYNGRAVVSNFVNTGLMAIVSVTLVDGWADLAGLHPGEGLREETSHFVTEWEASYDIEPNYQLIVNRIGSFLGEFSRWLNQSETAVLGEDKEQNPRLLTEFRDEVQEPIKPAVSEMFEQFEDAAGDIDQEKVSVHKSFAQRILHPFILCSPFVHRTYTKPLGYAGDYEMVNMMLYESQDHGANAYAQIVNTAFIVTQAPEAHRNRIDMLIDRIRKETIRATEEERVLKVLNVGCGPAVEIQRFIRNEELADFVELDLMDFNDETISYTRGKIDKACTDASRKPSITIHHKSIHDLLKEAHDQSESFQPGSFDYVYCAGLFDYFSDTICKTLVKLFYNWTTSGGLVTVTNVHSGHSVKSLMEHLLDWYLVCRNEKDMERLAPADTKFEVEADTTGANLFLDIRKR